MAIITISRLTGSGGREIASAVAELFGFYLIDRDSLDLVTGNQFDVVVLGCGGQFRFAKVSSALHVQIVAPEPYRIARVMRVAQVDRKQAEAIIEIRDEAKRQFVAQLYGADWRDPSHYDLVINIDHLSNDVAVQIIAQAARAKGIEARPAEMPAELREDVLAANRQATADLSLETTTRKMPEFAHTSEREFAHVMDYYHVRWEYEPRTFPIEWDENNNVLAAFTPDFYLPDLDLFIELTTMKQSLVTKKNRKIRRLREIYPDINIKILYERDYRNLIWKYGLSEPAEIENGSGRKIS